MTKVKLKFRPSTVADRPGTIVYFITHRRIVRQFTTEYKVFSDEWDEKMSKLVITPDNGRAEFVRTIAQRIHRDMERLNGIIEEFDRRRHEYSSEDIITEFRNTANKNTLFRFMEDVIGRLRQLQHVGTQRTTTLHSAVSKGFGITKTLHWMQ